MACSFLNRNRGRIDIQSPQSSYRTRVSRLTVTRVIAAFGFCVAVSLLSPIAVSQTAPATTGLKDLVGKSGLKVGFEVSPENLGEKAFTDTIKAEANIGTVGVYWKDGGMHAKSRYVFDWKRPDSVVSFLSSNKIEIQGMPLFWPNDPFIPDWVFKSRPQDARKIIEEHIAAVVGRYKGRVATWVVVNEAYEYDGKLRSSWFQKALGDRYFEIAFQAAAKADPKAKLIYNDYGLAEPNSNKFDSTLRMLTSLRRRKIRVDGVGFQLHLTARQILDPDFPLEERLWQVKRAGMRSHITELDILIPDLDEYLDPATRVVPERSEANLQMQKDAYKKVVEIYLRVEPTGSIQTWGVSDKQSWRGSDQFPLLFDEQFQKKPAYFGVHEALRGDVSGTRRFKHLWTGAYLAMDPRKQWEGAVVTTVNGLPFLNLCYPPAAIPFDAQADAGQVWNIIDIDRDGNYRLEAESNGRFLNVNGFDSSPANTYGFQESWYGQRWNVLHIGCGYYLIQNAWTGMFLQPQMASRNMYTWPIRDEYNNSELVANTTNNWLNAIWEIEYLPKPPRQNAP